jgi:hypothetical protein
MMSWNKPQPGVIAPNGKFHPSPDLSSAVATAVANRRTFGRTHAVAQRDPTTGRVIGAVRVPPPASNQMKRGRNG